LQKSGVGGGGGGGGGEANKKKRRQQSGKKANNNSSSKPLGEAEEAFKNEFLCEEEQKKQAASDMEAMNAEANEALKLLYFKSLDVTLHDKLDDLFYTYDSRASEMDAEQLKPIVERLKSFVFQSDVCLSQKLETMQAQLIEKSGDTRQEWMSGLETEYDARCPMCMEAFNVTTKVPMQSPCSSSSHQPCVMCSMCWIEANAKNVKRCLCARDFTAKTWAVDGRWIAARVLAA